MATKKSVSAGDDGDKKKKVKISDALLNSLTTASNINTEYVETKNDGFDLGISNGRGLPKGWAISMYAPPGCGKSTVCADIIYRLITTQKQKGLNFKVAYIDVEGSKELLKSMGLTDYMLSGDLLHFSGHRTFNELEEIYENILAGEGMFEGVQLVVVDSITGVTSQTLMDKECSAADYGSNAKERGRFYPKYLTKCKEKGITNIFISQVRVKQNAMQFEDPNRPAMSDMDKHWMDVIVKFTKETNSNTTDIKKIKIKTPFGEKLIQDRFILNMSTSIATGTKNRAGRIPDIKILVEYGKKCINTYVIREILEGLGFYKPNGNKTGFIFTDEFCDALEMSDLKGKSLSKKEFHSVIKSNISIIREMLKSNGYYRLDAFEKEETDGM